MTLESIDFYLTFFLKIFGMLTLIGTTVLVVSLLALVKSIQDKINSLENKVSSEINRIQYESELAKSRMNQGMTMAKIQGLQMLVGFIKKRL